MYCSECGKEIPNEADFCPYCGRMVFRAETGMTFDQSQVTDCGTTTVMVDPPKESFFRSSKFIALIIVVLVIGAVIFIGYGSDEEDEGSLSGKTFNCSADDYSIVSNADFRSLAMIVGFENGDASLSFVESDRYSEYYLRTAPCLELSEEIRNTYDRFTFTVFNEPAHSPIAASLVKTEGRITLFTKDCETYSVTVVCENTSTLVTSTYDFTFKIGYHNEWKYDGGRFSFDLDLDWSELSAYPSIGRNVSDWTKVTVFFSQEEPTIARVATVLEGLCSDAYGTDVDRQALADFVLGYVQVCFPYASDADLYGANEYFAFPVETMYFRAGDCEDTSILCAALFHALGYDSAVLMLPGHAMAGVALADYKDRTQEGSEEECLHENVKGREYYACETTYDVAVPCGLSGKFEDKGYMSKYLNQGIIGCGSYTFYTLEAA